MKIIVFCRHGTSSTAWSHHLNTIVSKGVLSFLNVATTCNRHILSTWVEFRHSMLCGFWQITCLNLVQSLMELRIWLIVILIRGLFTTISNQYNSNVLWMSLWVGAVAWSTAYAIVSSSSHLHCFYSTLSAYLWWFLEAAHLHVHHITVDIASRELVGWTLIRISNTLILTRGVVIIGVAHCVVVFVDTSSHISVTLTHSAYRC